MLLSVVGAALGSSEAQSSGRMHWPQLQAHRCCCRSVSTLTRKPMRPKWSASNQPISPPTAMWNNAGALRSK
jgi:hypothetical protein